jgi:hypothetical protein
MPLSLDVRIGWLPGSGDELYELCQLPRVCLLFFDAEDNFVKSWMHHYMHED